MGLGPNQRVRPFCLRSRKKCKTELPHRLRSGLVRCDCFFFAERADVAGRRFTSLCLRALDHARFMRHAEKEQLPH
jgi:hypothetical protein